MYKCQARSIVYSFFVLIYEVLNPTIELSWDDSREQMEISFLTDNTTNSGFPKSTTEESSSLTEPDKQNDDVFPADSTLLWMTAQEKYF